MSLKKFYIPIGALIFALVAIGLFALRSDTPKEPITIYKTGTPAEPPASVTESTAADVSEAAVTDAEKAEAASDGHFHSDGTWHAGTHTAGDVPQNPLESAPHSEETVAEKFHREMARKIAEKEARDAERKNWLRPIAEKGELLTSNYQDVLTITPQKYKRFSQDEKDEFYQRCVEVDRGIAELKELFATLPEWVKDDIEKRRSGTLKEFLNTPAISPVYETLAARGGHSNNEK